MQGSRQYNSLQVSTNQETTTLVSKVNLLLLVSLLLGGAGAYAGMHVSAFVAMVSYVVSFITILVLYFGHLLNRVQIKSSVGSVAFMCLFVTSMGVMVGHISLLYIKSLGQATVVCAYLGTAGMMAICGAIVAGSTTDFRRWEVPLYFALGGLCLFGIFGWWHQFPKSVEIGYCSAGIVVFTGFFLVDLCRYMRSTTNTWWEAVDITINLYLDYINFVMYILRLVSALKK